ncbi:MAG: stage III sporulation protein AF [Lachnospiraceae bacterium]|nr:stage III sporulation protein AF [Lachnospiraceae bacterium]
MDWMSDSLEKMGCLLLFMSVVEQLVIGEENIKKYIRFFIGLLVCLSMLQWLSQVLSKKNDIIGELEKNREQAYEQILEDWEEK